MMAPRGNRLLTPPTRFLRPTRADHQRVRDAVKELGAGLRVARLERRYSQQAIAEVAGMSQMKLAAAEHGRFGGMTIETLFAIIDRYDLRLVFEPRDAAVARYRAEVEQRAARRAQRELELES